MKKIISTFIFLFLLCPSYASAAVDIVECEDEEGNRSFQLKCPPGSIEVSKRKIATGTGSTSTAQNRDLASVTLYSISDCGDPCDGVRDYLQNRQISFSEIDVSDDLELQEELDELTGGTGKLRVPTITVGDAVIVGYKRSELISALEAGGYSETKSEENNESSE